MRSFALPAALALALAAPAAFAQSEPFRVVNRTPEAAVALHAVRSGRQDWGGNLLNRGPLGPGGQFALRPAEGAGCAFDLRMVLRDGQEIVRRNADICAERTVVMALPPQALLPPQAARPPVAAPGGGLPGAKPPALGPSEAGARPAPPPAAGARPNPQARVASGTGFVVAPERVLTNQHVIEGCSRLFVRTAENRMLPVVEVQGHDAVRDLALLRVQGNPGPVLAFRANPVRRGEGVVTYGFPLAGLLSSGPTLTTGEVSALAGLGDNQQQFQISAPVQQGNSGGPLLDRQGHVIGVVVSKLNAARIAQRTGDIPQNVNFAVKGTEAVAFLRRHGVTPVMRESQGAERSAAEVGEQAHPSTVFIRCER